MKTVAERGVEGNIDVHFFVNLLRSLANANIDSPESFLTHGVDKLNHIDILADIMPAYIVNDNENSKELMGICLDYIYTKLDIGTLLLAHQQRGGRYKHIYDLNKNAYLDISTI